MTAEVLKPWTVFLKRRKGTTQGRIEVSAVNAGTAELVALTQCVDVSYPDTVAADWVVIACMAGRLPGAGQLGRAPVVGHGALTPSKPCRSDLLAST